MMKDGPMSSTEGEASSPFGESSPTDEEGSPLQNMQTELHNKGAVLTKAWSDLFSFITKYQAELVVKENAVDIAESEIKQREKQLEDIKPVVDSGNDEVYKLKDEIRAKESMLRKSQVDLSLKERTLWQVKTDLSYNSELLEKARSDLLESQNDSVRFRADLGRLKSELTVKQEQIHIKDNLLRKLQNQLMKENAELKEQLELERRAHHLERQSHELTKRSMMSPRQSESRKRQRTSAPTSVIEIPDSPPTLDLSVDMVEEDFDLPNIMQLSESQPHNRDQISRIAIRQNNLITSSSVTAANTSYSSNTAIQNFSSTEGHPHFQMPSLSPKTQLNSSVFTSIGGASDSANVTFFPLQVESSDDIKPDVVKFDSDSLGPVPISGPMSVIRPQTPSSELCDTSNQGLNSGAISDGSSPRIPAEGGSEMQGGDTQAMVEQPPGVKDPLQKCTFCGVTFMNRAQFNAHIQSHTDYRKPFKCSYCGKCFSRKDNLKVHVRTHTGERPFTCKLCGKGCNTTSSLKSHMLVHMKH